jgi:predicted transcriptional regulator
VPTVVVLDRAGKIAWMRTGLAKAEEVRQRMNNL